MRSDMSIVESLAEVRGRLMTGPTKTRARRQVTLPRFLAGAISEPSGGSRR
jgi:hypothetical protein